MIDAARQGAVVAR